MPNKNTGAIAPWLGYKTQEYRLLQRLFESDNGSYLGFELLDDIEEHSGSNVVLEQDKITRTKKNIVSANSKDLWKTLSNWVDLISQGKIEPSQTTFLLYTHKKYTSEILKSLIAAVELSDAESVYDDLLKKMDKPSDSLSLYVNNFLKSKHHASLVIKNFNYIYGSGSACEDLKHIYLTKHLGALDEYADEILHQILGWVSELLTTSAEKKELTIIPTKAFGNRLASIESQHRQKSILRFIMNRTASSDDVIADLNSKPLYIKQLEIIELDDFIEDAVIAKLEASDAVVTWTLNGDVQESSYLRYQESLSRKWKIEKHKSSLKKSTHCSKEQGASLYLECLTNLLTVELEGKKVEDIFTSGTLQVMANELSIGWHPKYKEVLGDDDDTAKK